MKYKNMNLYALRLGCRAKTMLRIRNVGRTKKLQNSVKSDINCLLCRFLLIEQWPKGKTRN